MNHRTLISTAKLEETVARLAEQINAAYSNTENIMAIVILEGAKYFAANLMEKLSFPIETEYLKASSYCGTNSTGIVNHNGYDGLQAKIRDRNILVIDDIYDTGRTLSNLLDWIQDGTPRSIKTCILLEKEIPHAREIEVDFLGMKIHDTFVIGYGMDFDGQYRDLPFIAELSVEPIDG